MIKELALEKYSFHPVHRSLSIQFSALYATFFATKQGPFVHNRPNPLVQEITSQCALQNKPLSYILMKCPPGDQIIHGFRE